MSEWLTVLKVVGGAALIVALYVCFVSVLMDRCAENCRSSSNSDHNDIGSSGSSINDFVCNDKYVDEIVCVNVTLYALIESDEDGSGESYDNAFII